MYFMQKEDSLYFWVNNGNDLLPLYTYDIIDDLLIYKRSTPEYLRLQYYNSITEDSLKNFIIRFR